MLYTKVHFDGVAKARVQIPRKVPFIGGQALYKATVGETKIE
ncbi:hypothetical protein [Paenibacillus sp. N3.4]|nr:hypothetical protein [Paenibacillus sp. N3.4]